MSEKKQLLSKYRGMWLFAMFDLPVVTAKERREYTKFRKALLRSGFLMMQYSVYARYCSDSDRSDFFRRQIRSFLPPEGEVRLVAITDCQFGQMEVFYGKKRTKTEEPPEQLLLF